MLYIFGKLSSSECYANLACSAATYRFRDIRDQSLGFFGPYGVPQRGDFVSGTDIYHRAKFHADRCRRRRDTCNRTNRKLERITTDSISDKTHILALRLSIITTFGPSCPWSPTDIFFYFVVLCVPNFIAVGWHVEWDPIMQIRAREQQWQQLRSGAMQQ